MHSLSLIACPLWHSNDFSILTSKYFNMNREEMTINVDFKEFLSNGFNDVLSYIDEIFAENDHRSNEIKEIVV